MYNSATKVLVFSKEMIRKISQKTSKLLLQNTPKERGKQNQPSFDFFKNLSAVFRSMLPENLKKWAKGSFLVPFLMKKCLIFKISIA